MSVVRFSTVDQAQAYYTVLLQKKKHVCPIVVSAAVSRFSKAVQCVHLTDEMLHQCCRMWTYVLVYVEDKPVNNQQSNTDTVAGSVKPFGYINSALLHFMAMKHRQGVRLEPSHMRTQPFRGRCHSSFDFYKKIPRFRDRWMIRTDFEQGIRNHIQLLFDPSQCKEPLLTYVNDRQHTELDFAGFWMLAFVFKSHTANWLSPHEFKAARTRWIESELDLLKLRLTTSASHRMSTFLPSGFTLYARDTVMNNSTPGSTLRRWLTHCVPHYGSFVVVGFEQGLLSCGFSRRMVFVDKGVAVFPAIYILNNILVHARSEIVNVLERLQEVQTLPEMREFTQLALSLFVTHIESRPQRSGNDLTSGLREAMDYAPSCIRKLLHRAVHAGPNERLKYNERIGLSQSAAAIGIDWEELRTAAEANLSHAYPNPVDSRGVISTLGFAYKFERQGSGINCEKMIDKRLCGKIDTGKRLGIAPQEACLKELKQRTSKSFSKLFNPKWYFKIARDTLQSQSKL